jgi:hypothetical protein
MQVGDFVSRLSRINDQNISTFISAGAIGNAYIGNAAIDSAKIANVIQSNNFVDGSSGWRITKDGTANFNRLALYGFVTGSVFVPVEVTVTVTHNSGRYPIVMLWADADTGIPALSDVTTNSFSIYLNKANGNVVYYAYV